MVQQHGRNLRKGRASIPGQVYLVTTVTRKRQPIFTDFHCARIVINSLKYAEQARQAESLSYVIMPDHLHWLLSLKSHRPLQQVVANIKPGLLIVLTSTITRQVLLYGKQDSMITLYEKRKILKISPGISLPILYVLYW